MRGEKEMIVNRQFLSFTIKKRRESMWELEKNMEVKGETVSGGKCMFICL